MHDDRSRLLEAAQETIQRHEREEEQATVQLLTDRAGHGGLAVLGQQETLAAVNMAQVHKLVLRTAHTAPVWRGGMRCFSTRFGGKNRIYIYAELY